MSGAARGIAIAVLALAAPPLLAGSYSHVANCTATGPNAGCLMGHPVSQNPGCNPNCEVTSFGIVHPPGYTGTQTSVPVRICLNPADAQLEAPLQRAIELWNGLVALDGALTTGFHPGTCRHCYVWEDGADPFPADPQYALTTLLHELGHCAMGLDHVNRLWDVAWDGVFEDTSFTRSANAAAQANALDAGLDGYRGNRDDYHAGLSGNPAVSVSWYRTSDNNPHLADGAVIQTPTYTRNRSTLPGSDTWPESGNEVAGIVRGFLRTQSVMYSGIARKGLYVGLSADDVHMVRMGMTGPDLLAGTADDYTISLSYVGSCVNPHEISLSMDQTGVLGDELGVCFSRIDYTFPGDINNVSTARHFSVVPPPGGLIEILLNPNKPWDYSVPIWVADFEHGNLGEWVTP
jgi:hypothetical protein